MQQAEESCNILLMLHKSEAEHEGFQLDPSSRDRRHLSPQPYFTRLSQPDTALCAAAEGSAQDIFCRRNIK